MTSTDAEYSPRNSIVAISFNIIASAISVLTVIVFANSRVKLMARNIFLWTTVVDSARCLTFLYEWSWKIISDNDDLSFILVSHHLKLYLENVCQSLECLLAVVHYTVLIYSLPAQIWWQPLLSSRSTLYGCFALAFLLTTPLLYPINFHDLAITNPDLVVRLSYKIAPSLLSLTVGLLAVARKCSGNPRPSASAAAATTSRSRSNKSRHHRRNDHDDDADSLSNVQLTAIIICGTTLSTLAVIGPFVWILYDLKILPISEYAEILKFYFTPTNTTVVGDKNYSIAIQRSYFIRDMLTCFNISAKFFIYYTFSDNFRRTANTLFCPCCRCSDQQSDRRRRSSFGLNLD